MKFETNPFILMFIFFFFLVFFPKCTLDYLYIFMDGSADEGIEWSEIFFPEVIFRDAGAVV